MPAARKTTTLKPAARSTDGAPASRSAATRRELERRVARVEKLLEDAGEALQLLGKDLGRGAGDAYKELTRTARALRRDAQRTNQRMLKDFDKLRAAVTPSGTTQRRQATRRASGSERYPHRDRVEPVDPRHSPSPRKLDRKTDHALASTRAPAQLVLAIASVGCAVRGRLAYRRRAHAREGCVRMKDDRAIRGSWALALRPRHGRSPDRRTAWGACRRSLCKVA